jgi:hypothetical protein
MGDLVKGALEALAGWLERLLGALVPPQLVPVPIPIEPARRRR